MAYETIQEEATPLPQQTTLAFLGQWGYAYDDPGNSRTAFAAGYDDGGTQRAAIFQTTPHLRFAGDMLLTGGHLGIGTNPITSAVINVVEVATATMVGLNIQLGNTFSPVAGSIVGVAGYAATRVAGGGNATGLDFAAGGVAQPVPIATGCKTTIFGSGALAIITLARNFHSPSSVLLGGATIGTHRGFESGTLAGAGIRQPFYDPGVIAGDAHGNRFASNTQFGAVAGSFAGGLGVIGIANAAVAPAGVPVGGGVLAVVAGVLTYYGPAGTVTPIAPA